MISHFEALPANTTSTIYTCSHLCHTSKKCFAPNHVILESSTENNARQRCKVAFPCPACGVKSMTCTHDPVCIEWLE